MAKLREENTIYDRIKKSFQLIWGEKTTDKKIAEALEVSNHLIGKWKKGISRPSYEALEKINALTNAQIDYLVTGFYYDVTDGSLNRDTYQYFPVYNKQNDGEMNEAGGCSPANAAPINFVLNAKGVPVVGEAAADETQGRRAGFFPPEPDAYFDELNFPETTSAVRIIGNSMSPVLLDGQYALLGPEYSGNLDRPGDYDIVVASVQINDDEQAGSDAQWEGVYCKRVVDGGDVWFFLSINPTGVPFTIAKANCRLWPVVGVWFAGRGEPPKED